MSKPDLVTVFGGAGFLGSHVCDALSDAGYAVRIFDLTPSPWLRADQEAVIGDLLDRDAVMRACDGARYVYHFAGIADIGAANQDPARTASINVGGTIHALEGAAAAGAERFLFASTIYVYSRHGGFYRASKQAAECFIETWQQRHGMDYTILRYGTLYGRRADDNNRIHSMIRDALERGSIDYPGNGSAEREFIHARDAAQLSVRCLRSEYANRHMILTGQDRHTISELLRMLREILPGAIDIRTLDSEPEGHYELTPYSFEPRFGHKLVPDDCVDLGQGLLDCISEQVETHSGTPSVALGLGDGGRSA